MPHESAYLLIYMESSVSFSGRKLLIATKHRKEQAIAPILEAALGVIGVVPVPFDTDALGTFDGEVKRKTDPISTAREKCLLAMDRFNGDLAVASEGSFGPHPVISFVAANEEILLLHDRKNKLEIVARVISTTTNFSGRLIHNEAELNEFAEQVSFPAHGLILKPGPEDFRAIRKGIVDRQLLLETFNEFMLRFGQVYVETDMRALYNPSRMQVIEQATHQLVEKIRSCCSACGWPGFEVSEVVAGLPCRACRLPTRTALHHVYTCKHCLYTQQETFPHQKETEDPMYCDYCNP